MDRATMQTVYIELDEITRSYYKLLGAGTYATDLIVTTSIDTVKLVKEQLTKLENNSLDDMAHYYDEGTV